MGIDSLLAVELKARIERELGVAIPLLQLIKGPSLSELAGVLAASMAGDGAPGAGTEKEDSLLSFVSFRASRRASSGSA